MSSLSAGLVRFRAFIWTDLDCSRWDLLKKSFLKLEILHTLALALGTIGQKCFLGFDKNLLKKIGADSEILPNP